MIFWKLSDGNLSLPGEGFPTFQSNYLNNNRSVSLLWSFRGDSGPFTQGELPEVP